MMVRLALLCITIFLTTCSISAQSKPEDSSELFRKPIENGHSLVVKKRVIRSDKVSQIFKSEKPGGIANFYSVWVELQAPDSDPIVLASLVHKENDIDPAGFGFEVKDVYCDKGVIALAVVTGPDLAMWKIDPAWKEDHWTILRGWNARALRQKADPSEMKVDISSLPDERLKIVVDLTLKTSRVFSTVFLQKGKIWEFSTSETALDQLQKMYGR